jgi:hypothetical protein
MPGELYIGGEGVARGYLNRPELDTQRFVADPFSQRNGARLYRSGDLVRLSGSGELEFLGRVDHQVKLRGFRIELGEIEATLRTHPSVHEAIVMARAQADSDTSLVAYLSPAAGERPTPESIRQHLRSFLPEYMVPARFIILDHLPRMPNGKIDRNALPDPQHGHGSTVQSIDLPQNDLEHAIAAVWQEVLQLPRVDRRQNFFDAGGHSLKMAQVHAQLLKRLERPVSLVDLFQYPTVSSLASYLAGSGDADSGGVADPSRAQQNRSRMAALGQRQRGARSQLRSEDSVIPER